MKKKCTIFPILHQILCSAADQHCGDSRLHESPLHSSLRCSLIGVLMLTVWGTASRSKFYRQNSTVWGKDNLLLWQIVGPKIMSWTKMESHLEPDQPDRNCMFLLSWVRGLGANHQKSVSGRNISRTEREGDTQPCNNLVSRILNIQQLIFEHLLFNIYILPLTQIIINRTWVTICRRRLYITMWPGDYESILALGKCSAGS